MAIYQIFYKSSSQSERGSLSHLRNFINRREISGPESVTDKYRAHVAFIEDCLSAYVVTACLEILGMPDMNASPSSRQPHLIAMAPKPEQYSWLHSIAKEIYARHVRASSSLDLASDIARSLRNDEELIQSYHEDVLFRCSCGKTYQVKGWFKNHLQKIHGHSFTDEASLKAQAGVEPEKVLKSAFMRCALLFMDTNDAYAMGDGDRIFRNAKFEMLIDDAQGHTKYRLWLWRFLAYEKAILSPQLAMEYKWNATVNISGGVGRNIPCDNLVEIVVHRIKDKLRAQGANVTFKSALEASLSTQIADEIKNNLSTQYRSKPSGRRRTLADKSGDIAALVGQLMESKQFKDGQSETDCFKDFKDPFDRVDITEFVKWIQDQKDRASVEMILF